MTLRHRESHRGETAGSLASRVLACLSENGPRTAAWVADELDTNQDRVARVFSYYHGSRCHIKRWDRNVDGTPRARIVWAAGPGPSRRKPPPLGDTACLRLARARKRIMVNSVFALGAPIKGRKSLARVAGLS